MTLPNQKSLSEDDLTIDALRKKVTLSNTSEIDNEYEAFLKRASSIVSELDAQKHLIGLREKWSNILMKWITLLILFEIYLVLLIGFKIVDYSNHKWLIEFVLIKLTLEMIALGAVVIKNLYPNSN